MVAMHKVSINRYNKMDVTVFVGMEKLLRTNIDQIAVQEKVMSRRKFEHRYA